MLGRGAGGPGPRRALGTVQTSSYNPRELVVPANSTIFSLIQPTGIFHIGNYLGAVRMWRDVSEAAPGSARMIYGIADLHAITVPQDAGQLRANRYDAIASVLSTGIDPGRCIVYHQSGVPEHAELNWILSCLAGLGYLGRMTQWKSKSEALANPTLGLFAYPVLQAADIALYKSTHVPVGEDQVQHLELTRELVEKFNKQFGRTFPLPTTLLAPTKKILSLKNPLKKMSKSDPDRNATIFMCDDPDLIVKKVRKAVTDSISDHFAYDPLNRPGVSNMINIVSGLQRRSIAQVEDDIKSFTDHAAFKAYVSDAIIAEFETPRKRFNELCSDPQYLREIVARGNDRAREIAAATIKQVKKNVGLD